MIDKSTRRDFLKRTASIATGVLIVPQIIPSTALGMGGKLPPSDRITMGLIGVGSQGTSNMRGFLKRVKELQIVSACDVDARKLEKTKKIIDGANSNNDCRIYGDYREFLEKEKVDAVSIALPDHWHGLIYTAVANKKIDVYGEKPLARTIQEGRAIVNAVQKNNIVWQTGSWQRSVKNFRQGAELTVNGRIGKVLRVEVGLPDGGQGVGTPPPMEIPEGLDWELWLGPAPKVPFRGVCHVNWRWILDYSGGQLTDWAGHHIDIAQWGLGMERSGPVEIEGIGFYPQEGLFNVPVEYDFLCKYDNGVEMRVANASRQPHGMGTTWYGEKGWIHVDRGNRIVASNPKILEEVIGENEIHLYKCDDHVGNFLECIKTRKETSAPVDIAHRSISVGLLGEIAMTTGKKIKWNPETELIVDNPATSRLLNRPYRKPWTFPTT